MEVQKTKEWAEYVKSPSPDTLRAPQRVSAESIRQLISLLAENEPTSDDWQLANHLAIICTEHGYATEATYYAGRAVAATDDIRAQIAFVRALELRRFPLAVLHALAEARRPKTVSNNRREADKSCPRSLPERDSAPGANESVVSR